MSDKLLYFPYINLPHTDWTMRALLYYDSVSSIVPDEYFYSPEEHYEPHMLELLRADLVVPINPMHVFGNASQVMRPFIDFVKKRKYILANPNFVIAGTTTINRQKFGTSSINAQKFDTEIMDELVALGLAFHSHHNWYEVEKNTANFLMSYLTNLIAKRLELQPVSDIPIQPERQHWKVAADPKIGIRRNEFLEGLMPVPTNLDINSLQRFKEENRDLLYRFRAMVENVALDPRYDDHDLMREKIRELNYHKEDLTATMAESRLGKILFLNVFGLVGATMALSGGLTPTGLIGASASFLSAFYASLQIDNPENVHDQSGMKYLSLAEKKLRKANFTVSGRKRF